MVLERIRAWNERKAREWEEANPLYRRSRQWARDTQAESRIKLDAMANAQGYADHADKRRVKAKMRKGYRGCLTCGATVRPQAPWGFVRIVTLSLVTPGKFECPRCKGTDFTRPDA